MPRYFFDIQDGRHIPDHDGTVFANPEAARVAAVVASGEMLRDYAEQFWKGSNWQMHVHDEQGGIVCDLDFTGTTGAH
jgi:hypothetical protein